MFHGLCAAAANQPANQYNNSAQSNFVSILQRVNQGPFKCVIFSILIQLLQRVFYLQVRYDCFPSSLGTWLFLDLSCSRCLVHSIWKVKFWFRISDVENLKIYNLSFIEFSNFTKNTLKRKGHLSRLFSSSCFHGSVCYAQFVLAMLFWFYFEHVEIDR